MIQPILTTKNVYRWKNKAKSLLSYYRSFLASADRNLNQWTTTEEEEEAQAQQFSDRSIFEPPVSYQQSHTANTTQWNTRDFPSRAANYIITSREKEICQTDTRLLLCARRLCCLGNDWRGTAENFFLKILYTDIRVWRVKKKTTGGN